MLTGNGTSAFTANAVTEGGVLLGGASNAVSDTGVLAKGEILVGDGTTDPTKLTVGADDTLLTADSAQTSGVKWAAAGGGGGAWVYLTQSSASASSSIEFDNTFITSTYDHYVVLAETVVPVDDQIMLQMRVSNDNGLTFETTNYASLVAAIGSGESVPSSNSSSEILLGEEIGNDTNETVSMEIHIIGAASASEIVSVFSNGMQRNNAVRPEPTFGTGNYDVAETIDAIQFFMETGNISTGTFKLYGIKDS